MKRSRPRTIEFQPTSRGGAWPEAARKALDARRVARYPLSGRAGVNAIRSRDRGPSFLVRRVLLSRLLLVRFLILALDLDRLFDDVGNLVRGGAIGDGILNDPLGDGWRHPRLVRLFDQVLDDLRSDLGNVLRLLLHHHHLLRMRTRTRQGRFPVL